MKINAIELIRQVLFVMLLGGVLAGAWMLVFRPRNAADAVMRQQIEAKQKQLRKLNRATASIGNLRDELSELEKAIGFFQSKLPNEKEIDKVLEELWRLGEANQLTTKGVFTVGRGPASTFIAAGGPHAEQPIKMSFVGDYMGFYSFLLAVENQPRIMRIRQLSIKQEKGAEGRITADLEMSIFFERFSSES